MSDLGRILVADDQESFLAATVEILREQGYECDCAPDAATAARMLESAEYDLLITGYPSAQTAIQSIQLPVVAYLPKPFDYDELLKRAQDLIRNYRVFRVVKNMQQNLENWHNGLTNIRKTIENQAQYKYGPENIRNFFNFTLKNIADALLDLRNLTEAVAVNTDQQEVCNLLNCPRLAMLQGALTKVYTTLEKTKSAFRSKELGQLSRALKDVFEINLKAKNEQANNIHAEG